MLAVVTLNELLDTVHLLAPLHQTIFIPFLKHLLEQLVLGLDLLVHFHGAQAYFCEYVHFLNQGWYRKRGCRLS